MRLFEGTPVYIELTSEQKVFEIVTADQRDYDTYDIDWCDDHLHYHAQRSGGATFPHTITHRVGENGEKAHTYYWIAPHFEMQYQDGADPTHCIRLDARQLVPLLLSEEDTREEFLNVHEIPTLEEMSDLFVPNLISYWERYNLVEEGQVIYCSICKKSYDYEENVPCTHVQWCDECGFFSQPSDSGGEECPHRSEDGKYYVEPVEEEDDALIS